MVVTKGWQPPLLSAFAGVAAGVSPVLAITFGSDQHPVNDVAAIAMKEHLGWSQTEKRLVFSAFFVADTWCMFSAA
jgi:hypothetical protein